MIYPEWVKKHRIKGTAVKYSNGQYRLYKVHSKRVDGKSYPVVVHDEYLGIITENGVIPPKTKQVDVSNIEVKEFGESNVIYQLCLSVLEKLKKKYKLMAETIYIRVIQIAFSLTNSYLEDFEDPTFDVLDYRIDDVINQLYKIIDFDYITDLNTIYIVKLGGKWYLSNITEKQQKLLDQLKIVLEVKHNGQLF
jgi:hypothetical protein